MSIPAEPIPEGEYEQFDDETYVTEALIEKYHTAEGLARFRKWSLPQTLMLVHGKSVFFPADYERWLTLGMPGGDSRK